MAYKQLKIGDQTRSSGLMKTKALGKSSMLFNLGKPGSPATMPVACGGVNQPPCAEFKEVLNAIKSTGNYSNAQNVSDLDSYSREEKDAENKRLRKQIQNDRENAVASFKALREGVRNSELPRSLRNEAKNTEGTELNYLQSVRDRDRQIVENTSVDMYNLSNALSDSDISNFNAAESGNIKRKNKNYLKEAYKEYLSQGSDFTSQVDFSAYALDPKRVKMFQNSTQDEYPEQ